MNIILTTEAEQKLRALGVAAIYVFGSRAQDIAGPLSDYDFGILMKSSGHRRGDETHDAIYDILSLFCPRTLENDVLDIVFLNDVPLELRMHVVRYGQLIFDEQPHLRGRFEERVMEEYCDFRPLLNLFDQSILKAL